MSEKSIIYSENILLNATTFDLFAKLSSHHYRLNLSTNLILSLL